MTSQDDGAGIRIRPYRREDRAALYGVALATGHHGDDASDRFADPELLGHRYVGPYLDLEPELAFTAEDERGPCGYVLGARDTTVFYRRMVDDWLPGLLRSVPRSAPGDRPDDAELRAELHAPTFVVPRDLDAYPAHLHIDLLPRAQGRGLGRRMMTTLERALTERGAAGVHLGASTRNTRAQGFYRALGYRELEPDGPSAGTVLMGRRLP